MLLTFVAVSVATPVLFWVPGYLWMRRAGCDVRVAVALAPAATTLVAGAVVGLSVALPFTTAAGVRGCSTVLLAATIWCGLTIEGERWPRASDAGGALLALLAFVGTAAFLSVPSDPATTNELLSVSPERVESPRLPGAPVDHHLPYRTAQLALHKEGGSAFKEDFTNGLWWISDRTPLQGLAFAWEAAILGIDVPEADLLDLPADEIDRQPADDAGYYAYLLVASLLGWAGLAPLWLLFTEFASDRMATAATALATLMPGLFIYSVYPRPSMVVMVFALGALVMACRGQPWVAGAWIGGAYLIHPSGVFWAAPVAIVLAAGRPRPVDKVGVLARAGVGAALLAVPWQLFTTISVGAGSRMVGWPLGGPLEDGESFADALGDWQVTGWWPAIWTRVSALSQSVFPSKLSWIPRGDFGADDFFLLWVYSHAHAVVGLAGLVVAALAVRGLGLTGNAFGRFLVQVVPSLFVLSILFEGKAESFVYQTLLGLVALLALPAAACLATRKDTWRTGLIGLLAIEAFSVPWLVGMFVPVGVSAAHHVPARIVGAATMVAAAAVAWSATSRSPAVSAPDRVGTRTPVAAVGGRRAGNP